MLSGSKRFFWAFIPVVSFVEVVPYGTVLVASLAEEEVPSGFSRGPQAVRAEPLHAEHRSARRAHRSVDVPRRDPGPPATLRSMTETG